MAAITVGVPVYKGSEFVGETLRSLLSQSLEDFRVVISVDGADTASAETCEPFCNDSRVDMTVQNEQLGWAGNLNWLMSRCDTEFFCYWQQDDLTRPNYFERLLGESAEHPGAAAFYCDVQWFGRRNECESLPSIEGSASERMMTMLSADNPWVPFRGLIRCSALRAAGPIRTSHRLSSLEDMVWMVKLAREGPLRRVEGTHYFKRAHHGQLHTVWQNWSAAERRQSWVHHGIGLLETIAPVENPEDQARLIDAVLERLVSKRRWRLYDEHDSRFMEDFLAAAKSELRDPDFLQLVGSRFSRRPSAWFFRSLLSSESQPRAR